ncbi:hypothetical protein CBM2609_B110071 [Cupriavidus taiwanensis]|nr:hypothetical protein CBM2604_B120068 [Cupriavidus taiwanensis]SOZ30353.1 hypothetical protein CBM2609_B110071 [Cupriavidus taiwanensis]SOZ49621.1 hypothetical protein CBM2610_B90070 [Cupriavidus taiwanensis]SOZ65594.1 hypothetical protein CBM2615_B170061 [Cupriavidus taiwanensis]SPA08432.1 hypothetical protein CBM2625_B150061 [Cupriavidus taiwanensis]
MHWISSLTRPAFPASSSPAWRGNLPASEQRDGQDRPHPEVKSNETNGHAGSPAVGYRFAGRLWRRR